MNMPKQTPTFAFPIYIAGLILLFAGERILSEISAARIALSSLGFAAILAITALRIVVAVVAKDERRVAERTMAILAAVGVLAVLLYFHTAEPFSKLLFDTSPTPGQLRFESIITVTWIVLLLSATIPQVFGEIAMFPMRRAEHVEWRRIRDAVYSGLTLAFAVSYASLFVYIASELGVRADYSYFKTSQPGESTVAKTASMTEDLRVVTFFPPVNEVREQTMGYLRDLQKKSPNVKIEAQDRLLAPALAKEFKITQDGVIVLSRGTQFESIQIGTDIKSARRILRQLDREFEKSLTKVLVGKRTAYLTTGHGELNDTQLEGTLTGRSAGVIKAFLEMQNYTVRDLSLVQGLGRNVPDDATIVLVLGPMEAFTDDEVASLDRYVTRGGNLLLALEPEGKANNEALAAIAGVVFKPGVLCNSESYVVRRRNASDQGFIFSNRFSSHASVSTLRKLGSRIVLFSNAGAFEKAEAAVGKVDNAVMSLPGTWADLNGNYAFDEPVESKAVFNLAVAVTRPAILPVIDDPKPDSDEDGTGKASEKKPTEARVFLVGDSDVLSDALMGPSNVALNQQFGFDVLRWLGGEEAFAGVVETPDDVRIEHTKQKDKVYFYLTIFGVPALVLGIGLLTHTLRQRRTRKTRNS
ncbi:MAG: Gldg family protein [Polyangiaceae bacterium]|nr:Gldg family protein [Polyangiaceae bacterium]